MTFGKEIKNLREKKGLKQYELAERLGIKPAYVCDIENGRRKPHSNTFIENVCQALDLTIGERLKLYSLSYNLPKPLSNSKQEFLSQIANMELRDQLEAKEQMIKNYKDLLHSCKIMLLGYRFKQTDVGIMNVTDGLIEKIDEVLR